MPFHLDISIMNLCKAQYVHRPISKLSADFCWRSASSANAELPSIKNYREDTAVV